MTTNKSSETALSAADVLGVVEPPAILQDAFVLPEAVAADSRLAALHRDIVAHLRAEARHLPMTTIQTLMLERIAYYYVTMRAAELSPDAEDALKASAVRANTNFWLSMTQEFNRVMLANQDKMREAMLDQIQGIIESVLPLITSDDERRRVRIALAEKFAAVDL